MITKTSSSTNRVTKQQNCSTGFEHLPCQIAGVVKGFNESDVLNANERRSANRTTGFAMSAAVEATNQAALDFALVDSDRAGVCFGSSLAGFIETVSCGILWNFGKYLS